MSNNYKNQKGIILPVVLIFFSVLMLLGVTFVSVSGFQVSQSMSQVNRSQAYYLAKSGAEVFADYLNGNISNEEDIDQFIGQVVELKIPTSVVNGGNVQIYVYKDEVAKSVKIVSKAEYRKEISEVSLELKYKNITLAENIVIPQGKVLVVVNNDEFIKSDDFISLKNKINDEGIDKTSHVSEEQVPKLVIPEISNKIYGNDGKDNDLTIYEDTEIMNLSIKNNLYIDFKDQAQTIILYIRKLEIKGNLNLINTTENSRLILFVDELTTSPQSKFNIDGNPNQLILAPTENLDFSNKVEITGVIYAPDKIIGIPNIFTLNGSLITHSVTLQNNADKITMDNKIEINLPIEELPTVSNNFELFFADNPWIAGDDYE